MKWKLNVSGGKDTYPVDLVETVHIQLPDETGELFKGQGEMESEKLMRTQFKPELVLTLLCLK